MLYNENTETYTVGTTLSSDNRDRTNLQIQNLQQAITNENIPTTIFNQCHKYFTYNNILYYHSTLLSSTAAGKKAKKMGTINFLTSLQPSTGNAPHIPAPCPPTRLLTFSVFVFL